MTESGPLVRTQASDKDAVLRSTTIWALGLVDDFTYELRACNGNRQRAAIICKYRDAILGLDDTVADVASLFLELFGQEVPADSDGSDIEWTRFKALAQKSAERKDIDLRHRLGLQAAIVREWGHRIVSHYQWHQFNLDTTRILRKLARLKPRWEDASYALNLQMLQRHKLRVVNGHNKSLKIGQHSTASRVQEDYSPVERIDIDKALKWAEDSLRSPTKKQLLDISAGTFDGTPIKSLGVDYDDYGILIPSQHRTASSINRLKAPPSTPTPRSPKAKNPAVASQQKQDRPSRTRAKKLAKRRERRLSGDGKGKNGTDQDTAAAGQNQDDDEAMSDAAEEDDQDSASSVLDHGDAAPGGAEHDEPMSDDAAEEDEQGSASNVFDHGGVAAGGAEHDEAMSDAAEGATTGEENEQGSVSGVRQHSGVNVQATQAKLLGSSRSLIHGVDEGAQRADMPARPDDDAATEDTGESHKHGKRAPDSSGSRPTFRGTDAEASQDALVGHTDLPVKPTDARRRHPDDRSESKRASEDSSVGRLVKHVELAEATSSLARATRQRGPVKAVAQPIAGLSHEVQPASAASSLTLTRAETTMSSGIGCQPENADFHDPESSEPDTLSQRHARIKDEVRLLIKNVGELPPGVSKAVKHSLQSDKPSAWAKICSGPQDKLEADVWHFTWPSFKRIADSPLPKPVIIKQNFQDDVFLDQDFLSQAAQQCPQRIIEVHGKPAAMPEEMSLLEYATQRSRGSGSADNASTDVVMRLGRVARADEPFLTRLPRFRLLRTLVERATHASGKHDPTALKALSDSLEFNLFARNGVFTFSPEDSLFGTWVRCLSGSAIWIIAPIGDERRWKRHIRGQSPELPGEDARMLRLEANDVLFIPPGVRMVRAVYVGKSCLMEGGRLWDAHSIPEVLDGLLSMHQVDPDRTIIHQLGGLLVELEKWVDEGHVPSEQEERDSTKKRLSVLRSGISARVGRIDMNL